MKPEKVDKPLRQKDWDAIETWLAGSTLVDAYRKHIARDPGAARARQAASGWFAQPHIREAVKKARADALAASYGDIQGLLVAQLAKFEAIYAEGMKERPDGNGVMRPESLPAALGATISISRLFQQAQQTSLNKLNMLKLWTAIRGDLRLPHDVQLAIEQTIMDGGDL